MRQKIIVQNSHVLRRTNSFSLSNGSNRAYDLGCRRVLKQVPQHTLADIDKKTLRIIFHGYKYAFIRSPAVPVRLQDRGFAKPLQRIEHNDVGLRERYFRIGFAPDEDDSMMQKSVFLVRIRATDSRKRRLQQEI